MSAPQPTIDTEPDVDVAVDHGPANSCAVCGFTGGPLTWGPCAIPDGRDAYGPRWRYVDAYRCSDRIACRQRAGLETVAGQAAERVAEHRAAAVVEPPSTEPPDWI